MANANYPPRSLDQATTLFTEDSKIIHDVVNGDATTEVTVDDNNTLPSIRKTLVDNFHFLSPLDWNATGNTEVFNQLFKFTDGLFYYAPTALAGVPVVMGATPVGDPLWVLYSALELKTLRPVAISLNVPLASVGNVTAGETLRQYVFDGEITYKVPTGAIGKLISSVVGTLLTTTDTLQYPLERFTTSLFKGGWGDLVGSLSKGSIVAHNNNRWELLVDLPDVTASGPSTSNPDWEVVVNGVNENLLVNGDFTVWQRKGSGTNVYTDEYMADRFRTSFLRDGVAHVQYTAQVAVDYVDNKTTNKARIMCTDNRPNNFYMYQRLGAEEMAGSGRKEVTLSFSLNTSNVTNNPDLLVNFSHAVARNDFTSQHLFHSVHLGKVNSSTQGKYSATVTLPDNASLFGLQVAIHVSNTDVTASINAGGNITLDISEVKLERGSVATPFVPDHPQINLAKCQRYYEKVRGTSSTSKGNYVIYPYKTTKRAVPAVTITEGDLMGADLQAWNLDSLRCPSGIIPTGDGDWVVQADSEL